MFIVVMGSEDLNKNFSIFGDSISTFEGSNPDIIMCFIIPK